MSQERLWIFKDAFLIIDTKESILQAADKIKDLEDGEFEIYKIYEEGMLGIDLFRKENDDEFKERAQRRKKEEELALKKSKLEYERLKAIFEPK